MLFTESVYVGIDPTSGRKAFTYAALDNDLNLVTLADGELEDVIAYLAGQKSATVAINSPSQVNHGLVRKTLEKQSLTPHSLRGVEMRVAEFALREHGIAVHGTGSRESQCLAWVQIGFALYRKLSKLGFRGFSEDGGSHQWMETHPDACFCVMLDEIPLSKPTLEGRLQRELILYEKGVRIKDPMFFFEEITRHKLIKGILPMELVYPPEQLDALVASYTAWLASQKPAEVMRIGNRPEGFITLPTRSLREKY